ncbi:RsmE family RNA methyltransferase [uncultured Ilumatobacter sp.]|uniref:RsmE family RNA methyltransferase n=1 Tax=uncultured Ilumatobacter sp. TaxID=879968 RepID=UPI00374F7E41
MTVDEERRSASTQIFVAGDVLDIDGPIVLDSDVEHHLTRVLRLSEGERVSVSDGVGRWRLAAVIQAGGFLALEPVGPVVVTPRPHPPLSIATAIPKGDRVDWLVQKAVEIGIDTVQFLHAERSVVRWKAERAAKQVERLNRIAHEAARQSRRVWLPEVRPPVPALEVLASSVVAEPGGRDIAVGDTFISIGPEGGWSPSELAIAAAQVHLGHNVLRTETAVLVAATLCVAYSY